MTDTYKGSFFCLNCDWEGELDIPKGTDKWNFKKDTKCPNCDTLKLDNR